VSERLFTAAEVNGLIPRLSDLMERAMDHHRRAAALQRHLHDEQARIQSSGGGRIDPRAWKARAELLDGLTIDIRRLLQEIMELGGVTKDLEMGLVDFPGMVGDGPANLCWKAGETEVRFWHGFDEGFAQRKPLP
jgi:hypothetical protein